MKGPTTNIVEHQVPVRWADLDVMRHLNNARFMELAEHSAQLLIRGRLWRAPGTPFNLQATYLAPVSRSGQSLIIRNVIHERTLTQDILQDAGAGDLVGCAQLVISPAATETSGRPAADAWSFDHELHSRPADKTDDGTFTLASYFTYAQEARIRLFAELLDSPGVHDFVIAHVSLDVNTPLTWQPEPHPVKSRIGHLGSSSVHVETEFGAGEVIARTVVVGYDSLAQHSRPLSADERTYFDRFSMGKDPSWSTSPTL